MFHSFHRVPTCSKWHPQYEFNENGKYLRELEHSPLPSNNMVGCWASCESPLGFGPYGFHWLLWWDNREFCRTVPLQMWKLCQTGMEGLEKEHPSPGLGLTHIWGGCESNFLGQNNANIYFMTGEMRRQKTKDVHQGCSHESLSTPSTGGFYLSGRNLIHHKAFFFKKKENIFLIVAASCWLLTAMSVPVGWWKISTTRDGASQRAHGGQTGGSWMTGGREERREGWTERRGK